MKKVWLIVGVFVCAISAQAQSDYLGRHVDEVLQARRQKVSAPSQLDKVLAEKAALSAIEVGDYLFTPRKEIQNYNGGKGKAYLYESNKMASFTEEISVGPTTGEVHLIRGMNRRFLGSVNGKKENYLISQIVIAIYQDNRLKQLAEEWENQFGSVCVREFGNTAKLRHTPTTAFLTPDGRTVVVSADAASDTYGKYRRDCRVNAPGVLFHQFNKAVSQLQKAFQ